MYNGFIADELIILQPGQPYSKTMDFTSQTGALESLTCTLSTLNLPDGVEPITKDTPITVEYKSGAKTGTKLTGKNAFAIVSSVAGANVSLKLTLDPQYARNVGIRLFWSWVSHT